MATAAGKTRCIICGKEKATMRCGGCLEEYCHKHMGDHRQELNKQLDEIEVNRDLFRQSLTQQIEQPNNHILIQQTDEARKLLIKDTNKSIEQIEINLTKLTNELRESRHEDDFNERNLCQFQEELTRLTKELTKPSNISIREDSTPFINQIFVEMSGKCVTSISIDNKLTFQSNIHHNTRWRQNGVTVAGGNGQGSRLDQLFLPAGLYVDDDQTVYVGDCGNYRVVAWKYGATTGQVVAGGNGEGNKTNQVYNVTSVVIDKERNDLIICDANNRRVVRWPLRNGSHGQMIISNIDCSSLTMDKDGYIYVSDLQKSEVRRWKMNDTSGTLVAGGNGKGNRLDQLRWPTSIFVDEDYSLYVSDVENHRVMKWTKGANEGIVVAGGQGKGKNLTQLSSPEGLIVDHLGTVYVADSDNHRIMRWLKGATHGSIVVGGNGPGEQPNQLTWPDSLSFDRQGNIYVVDKRNARVQRFDIDQS